MIAPGSQPTAQQIAALCSNSCLYRRIDLVANISRNCGQSQFSSGVDGASLSLNLACKKNKNQQYCGVVMGTVASAFSGIGGSVSPGAGGASLTPTARSLHARSLEIIPTLPGLITAALANINNINTIDISNVAINGAARRRHSVLAARSAFTGLQTGTANATSVCAPGNFINEANACVPCPGNLQSIEANQKQCKCGPNMFRVASAVTTCEACPSGTTKPYGDGMCRPPVPTSLPIPSQLPSFSSVPLPMPSIDFNTCPAQITADAKAQFAKLQETLGCCLGESVRAAFNATKDEQLQGMYKMITSMLKACGVDLTLCTPDGALKGVLPVRIVIRIRNWAASKLTAEFKRGLARDIAVNLAIDIDRVNITAVTQASGRMLSALDADAKLNVDFEVLGDNSFTAGLQTVQAALSSKSATSFDMTNTNEALGDPTAASLDATPVAQPIVQGSGAAAPVSSSAAKTVVSFVAAALAFVALLF